MSISITPPEVLTIIGCYLAKVPKDLVHFGATCKKTYAIAKSDLFKNLLQFSKEESSARKRFMELKGPSGNDGLVFQALVDWSDTKTMVENAAAKLLAPAHKVEDQQAYNEARERQANACKKYDALAAELKELSGHSSAWELVEYGISGGKILKLTTEIQSELKIIQKRVENEPDACRGQK